jgi:hypothetical protein
MLDFNNSAIALIPSVVIEFLSRFKFVIDLFFSNEPTNALAPSAFILLSERFNL